MVTRKSVEARFGIVLISNMERMDFVKKFVALLLLAGFVLASGMVGCSPATSAPASTTTKTTDTKTTDTKTTTEKK